MDHIIIRETASEMRAIARKALRGNWKSFAIAMAIYYLLMITLPLVMDELIPGATFSQLDAVTGESVEVPIISYLYSVLLTGPFTLGLASFSLCYFRNKDLHPGHLFDGFEIFLKCIGLTFVMGFYIFLWSLLFLIPGIIAAFRYSQAFYILADHPEYSIGQCISLSKEYMKGNKGKLFCFELSFIGWAILASVAVIPLDLIQPTGIMYVLGDYVFSIPHFFFLAYSSVGSIVFYELVSGNLMARPAAPAPQVLDPLTPIEPVDVQETSVPQPLNLPSDDQQDSKNDEFDF